jgi:UDP-N-acetylglucosamine 2-epimerase (non-hydrolysing)
MARIHFCPDTQALTNLEKAGAKGERVLTSGNTMKDALRIAQARSLRSSPPLRPYAVFSMHRHENLFNDVRLNKLLGTLRQMAAIIDTKFVLHPVTRKRLQALGVLGELDRLPGLELLARMDFMRFTGVLAHASFVATDGGSNQEECAMLGIPCLLLRQATERMDGLGAGVVLSNYDPTLMLNFARRYATAIPMRRVLDDVSPSRIIVDRLGTYGQA